MHERDGGYFMDDFIVWLESRGETFFGLTSELKEEEE